MQGASPGDASGGDILDLLELDLADPLGPDLFEGEWIAPQKTMEGGDEHPEWTAADLLFEPYVLTLMHTADGASSNVNAHGQFSQGAKCRRSTSSF
jgi:hypothetical protein